MSLEDFQLLDKEPFDNSIIKRDYLKTSHQQGAHLNQPDQNVEFIFGDNNNYHQIGISYLEFDLTVRRNDSADFDNDSAIRLTNNGSAYVFKEARLRTTSGSDVEHIKFVGQISSIVRCLTNKDCELLSQFDDNNEGGTEDIFRSTSLKNMFY